MGKLVLFVMLLAGVAFAQVTVLTTLQNAVSQLCVSVTQLLPPVAMLMVVVSGVIYAAGQIMGAETRARANVWATAALVGALIGLLIFAVAPPVLSTLLGTQITCTP